MKIAVLVSGGVDSSVALALLARRRPDIELRAYYLKVWLEDELAHLGHCPWEDDLRHARAVTDHLGVPLEVVPLQTIYHERVVAHAIAELAAGRTPSPDLHCNERVKLGAFLDAIGPTFDRVATGHYARVLRHEARPRLHAAADPIKDQTYFLSRLSPEQLARLDLPLGDLHKREVRAVARALGLATQDRKDSQGICFLGKIRYPEFVRHHLGLAPGPIVDIDSGAALGSHQGLWFHTIGQRKGLGLGGGPWFVVDKELTSRTLFVAHAERVAAHQRADFEVADLRWLAPPALLTGALRVKLRHGPASLGCTVDHGREGRLRVRLSTPDPGVAPGQFAVFYRDLPDAPPECLGSGVIQ